MGVLAVWRRPKLNKRPATNLAKRRMDSPDCQDAGPRNLILHDQPESRRSRIGHQGAHFEMSAGVALSPETRGLPGARAGSFHELGTRHASSPGTSQSPGAAVQRAEPRGV